MSNEPRPDFDPDPLLRALARNGVDFVVIGGIATMLHGSARNTFDLDICFAPDAANLEALGAALTGLGGRLRGVQAKVPFIPDAGTLRRVELLTLATTSGDLDVLARPPGAPDYETLRSRADRFDLGGYEVLVASIDDLLAMKRAAGRGKDQEDIETLEALKRLEAE